LTSPVPFEGFEDAAGDDALLCEFVGRAGGVPVRDISHVTTELIVAELHALAVGRSYPDVALEIVRRLTTTGRIDVESVGSARLASAIDLLAARPGRPYSLADAVSFVVMRERGIHRVFTLDADFGAEGFEVVPAT